MIERKELESMKDKMLGGKVKENKREREEGA